jgi:hypothetical protein
MTKTPNTLENPSRRAAMRRLGLAVATAYIVPEVVMLSGARASSSSNASGGGSFVTPPTPPTAPSNVDTIEADVKVSDTCQKASASERNQSITISQSDFDRAQEAVEAGYAKPLEAIWPEFSSNYSGKVIGIEFTGFRWRPRYRFKAISANGHLETVIVSARTGLIEKVVGC